VLTFTTWFGDDDPELRAGAGAGYHVCLDQLLELVDTGSARPAQDEVVARWEARYAEAVRERAAS
jgi:hypothetical protein